MNMINKSTNTFRILGIEFDVAYECEVHIDPYGTGDSPTLYEISIESIKLSDSEFNIDELLSEHVTEELMQKIIRYEGSML